MKCRSIGVAASLTVLAAGSAPSISKAQRVDRRKPPGAGPAAPFAFPKMQTRVLQNGLRLIVVEDHALPLVAVRAVVLADSLDDPVGKEGLYALTAGMLREGTATRSSDQLATAAAALGNVVFPFRFTTIAQNLEPSLELMADMLMHPSFPQSALERIKTTIGANQQRMRQQQATIPNQIFLSRLFGPTHPVARSTSATTATMAGITREDLQHFHATYFRPNNTTIVVVGDVTESTVATAISRLFGTWERGVVPRPEPSPVSSSGPTTIYLLDRPGGQQSYIFVGSLGPPRSSEDFASLEVVAQIVGATNGSRLYDNLRTRHSYMYSGTPLAMTWRRDPLPSVIGGSAAVATAKTDSALIEWLGELRRIREHDPAVQEMAVARSALVDALPVQIETDDLIANRIVAMIQAGFPLDFYNSYGTRIDAVKPATARAVAAKHIDPSMLVIVVAGDRKVIEPLLRAADLAPIVIIDESGKS